jgi:hypothetical protein
LENAPSLRPCSAAWRSSKRESFQAYCARIKDRSACNRLALGFPPGFASARQAARASLSQTKIPNSV